MENLLEDQKQQRELFFKQIKRNFALTKKDLQNFLRLASSINGEISETLKCKICNFLMYEPHECNLCKASFCKKCLVDQLQQANECPVCTKTMQPQKVDSNILQQLENMILKCNNCNDPEVFKYDDFLAMHASKCYQKPQMKCPLRCKAILKDQISGNQHFNICECVLIRCQSCGQKFLRKDEHIHRKDLCSHSLIECLKCNREVMRKDLEKHSTDHCPESRYECEKCSMAMKRKDRELHTKQCLEEEIGCTRCSQMVKRKVFDLQEHNCVEYLLKVAAKLKDKSDEQKSKIKILVQENKTLDQYHKQFSRICHKIGHDYLEIKVRNCKPNDKQCQICEHFESGNDKHNFKSDKKGLTCTLCNNRVMRISGSSNGFKARDENKI